MHGPVKIERIVFIDEPEYDFNDRCVPGNDSNTFKTREEAEKECKRLNKKE